MPYRLFFALWPSAAERAAIADFARHASHRCGVPTRLTPAGNLHLTLAFLGRVNSQSCVDHIVAAASQLHSPPFDLQLQRSGMFRQRENIVWMAPDPIPAALLSLQAQLVCTLDSLGLPVDKRPYRPHVTLFKTQRADPLVMAPGEKLPSWPIKDFVLVNSRLGAREPSYEILQRFPLTRGTLLDRSQTAE